MFRLRAIDGYQLGAELHESPATAHPRRALVLHGGAGIAAARYRHFAQFLAGAGIPVLTYDYRGVGASRPQRLRDLDATTADWVEFDAAAAIGWLRRRYPQAELIGLSHSIGALALGVAPNAADQDRLAFIAPHTAYYGDYRPAFRLPMFLLWHGVMPLATRLCGYFPARALRLGDDLPPGIALEWASRRTAELRPRGRALSDARTRRLLDAAGYLARPAQAITVSDDAFATAAGARRLLSYLPGLAVEHRVFTPQEAKVARLGHFGFFRRAAGAVLWPRLLALLEA